MKSYSAVDLENVAKVINSLDPSNPQDLVTLNYLETELLLKQDTLVSGVSIKTINGTSVLGAGDIVISSSVNWGSILGTLSTQTDLQAALDNKINIEQNTITKDPTGFPNRTDSTFSFNNGTRTFTIQPTGSSFDIWAQGVKTTISSPVNIVLPNTTAKYFIYFEPTGGTLGYSVSFSDSLLNLKVFTATVYWNSTTGKGEFVVDERHGLTMDWATHFHMHNAFGTRYYGGFGLSFTILGDGSNNADAQIALSGGTIADEDIPTTIVDAVTPSAFFEQTLSAIAEIPVCYNLATGWQKDTSTLYPVKKGTNTLYYNTGSLVEAANSHFVAYWVFATPSITEPIISIMGTREDSSLSQAQSNNTYASIDFGDLPSQEYKILYRLIYKTNSSYTNAVSAYLADVQDLRGAIDSSLTSDLANPVTDHGLLTGLLDDDHTNYFNQTRGDARYSQLLDNYLPTKPTILRDDFISGTNETGEIGDLNWSVTNGSVTTTIAFAIDHPGIIVRQSSATNNQINTLFPSRLVTNLTIHTNNLSRFTWIIRFPTAITNHSFRLGVSADWSTNTPTNAIFFRKANTDANWILVSRAGGLETTANSGVAPALNTWYKLEVIKLVGSITYYINDVLVGTISTNLPNAGVNYGNAIQNNTAAAYSLEIDYFSLLTTDLIR